MPRDIPEASQRDSASILEGWKNSKKILEASQKESKVEFIHKPIAVMVLISVWQPKR